MFQEMEVSSPKLKKFLYFLKTIFVMSQEETCKARKTNKIYYEEIYIAPKTVLLHISG